MPTGNLDHIFRSAAALFADKVAVESAETALSYADLDSDIDKVAAGLHAEGVVPGDILGMAVADGLRFVTALFAIWRIGATPAPLDAWAKPAEVDGFADRLRLRGVVADLPAFRCSVCPVLMVAELKNTAAGPTAAAGELLETVPAYIALTSGTTGRPRAAALTTGQLYARFTSHIINRFGGPDDRFLATLPMRFGGMRTHALARLLTGGTVIFHPTMFAPWEIADSIQRLKVKSVFLVPAVVRQLLDLAEGDQPFFPGLSRLDCSGDFMLPDEKRAALRRLTPGFHECYGATAGGVISILAPEDIEAHAESVGRPAQHVLVQIVDESDKPQEPGETGRLRFFTPGNATAYLDDDEADNEMADDVASGWAYPGDLAALDADGFLHLRGRAADIIIRGGANIFPAEIEEVVAGHPDIREVCAVGWPSTSLGEEIVLFVVVGGETDQAAIRSFCRANLGPQKQPKEIIILDALPRNANGKVVRRDLAATLPARD